MDTKQITGFVASAVAVLGGGLLLYFPPATLNHDAVVGLAFSLVTGGFGGLGVTVAVPAAINNARAARRRASRAAKKPPE